VPATVQIQMPDSMVLRARDNEELARRARFLLALKFFELGELSSGQAAAMAGLPRVVFLFEAGQHGVPVADLDPAEAADEFQE